MITPKILKSLQKLKTEYYPAQLDLKKFKKVCIAGFNSPLKKPLGTEITIIEPTNYVFF